MGQAASALSSVLERERTAALSADVDALTQLQEEKRAALTALYEDELTDEELTALRMRAMSNVQLIRHLTACLQGMISPQPATYTAGGARPVGAMSRRSWGRL